MCHPKSIFTPVLGSIYDIDFAGSTCRYWQIKFDGDGSEVRCSTSDLVEGWMQKLMPPYLVEGWDSGKNSAYFDAKTADSLCSVRPGSVSAAKKQEDKKVVTDRFLFTNAVVMRVLGGNGMDTFRHPAVGKKTQYVCDQSAHVQPDWNPLMPKHAGSHGAMLLKNVHGFEGMETNPLFVCRGPSDAKDYETTRKWEYCGNYTVPDIADDDDVMGQVEFVAMGPHVQCPHCNDLHSLFEALTVRDVATQVNRSPNIVIDFRCPKSKSKTKKGKEGQFKVVLLDESVPEFT